MSSDFYCYVLLDPRKPGPFVYEGIEFDFEPFYVGKGQGRRASAHLTEAYRSVDSGNRHKKNKIRKIESEGYEVIVKTTDNRSNEKKALRMEQRLIAAIGRRDLKDGPLTNLTAGGESGIQGPRVRKRIAATVKANWEAMSDEEKEAHARKSGNLSKKSWAGCSAKQRAARVKAATEGIRNMTPEAKARSNAAKSKGTAAYRAAETDKQKKQRADAFRKTMSEGDRKAKQYANVSKGHARRSVEAKAETSKLMTAAWSNRKPKKCPHCKMESVNYANLSRWHFDNCKQRAS